MSDEILIRLLGMDDGALVGALLVFLVLTSARHRGNKGSRRTGGTGRHRKADGPDRETDETTA